MVLVAEADLAVAVAIVGDGGVGTTVVCKQGSKNVYRTVLRQGS